MALEIDSPRKAKRSCKPCEHQTVGSSHRETREEADRAVRALGWNAPWYVDANFFTIDVADYIGKQAHEKDLEQFVEENAHLTGEIQIPGTSDALLHFESITRSHMNHWTLF